MLNIKMRSCKEHFGRWGDEARNFLQHLGKRSLDEVGRPNIGEFMDFFRKRFSIQLQKCNVKVKETFRRFALTQHCRDAC